MTGLETAFAVVKTAVPGIKTERLVELLSVNPRKLFGLKNVLIQEGAAALLTLFDPAKKWICTTADIRSKSKNSAFIGKELTGKVIGIINNSTVILN
jgi:dihydroorotase